MLKYSIKTMDNSQGKCGRYKAKLRPIAHWSNDITALSRIMNNSVRRRIAVAPNDNSSGKSSRFKGHAIVCGQTPSAQLLEHAIVCVSPPPPSRFSYLRNQNTMTPPMSSGIQRPCFLPSDPPHRCLTPNANESNSPLPPSTLINLPPINILPPPLQLQMLPPSNVTLPLPPNNDPLPLPTMLIKTLLIPLPPSSSAI